MRSSPSYSPPLLLLFLSSLTSAYNIDCKHIRADNQKWNFDSLDGPHTVWTIDRHPPTYGKTNFTINVCRPLKKSQDEDCPNGSRVCAIDYLYHIGQDDPPVIEKTIPIAGDFTTTTGGHLDPVWTRLKTSTSTSDREKEGLRLEMNGGKYLKQKQKAIVEFLCNKDPKPKLNKREEDDNDDEDDHPEDTEGEEQDDGHNGKIKYLSYEEEENDTKVLRLEWSTKYACEDASSSDDDDDGGSSHWGFFTWLIIILFMGIAAYLIFGSWLNYNRYSARGWDIVPHSDFIQDLPYLAKDWGRKIVSTVRGGGGSRGGYSAV